MILQIFEKISGGGKFRTQSSTHLIHTDEGVLIFAMCTQAGPQKHQKRVILLDWIQITRTGVLEVKKKKKKNTVFKKRVIFHYLTSNSILFRGILSEKKSCLGVKFWGKSEPDSCTSIIKEIIGWLQIYWKFCSV